MVGLLFGERRCHDGHHILYSERTDAHLVRLPFHDVHLAVVGMQHGRHCRLYAEELQARWFERCLVAHVQAFFAVMLRLLHIVGGNISLVAKHLHALLMGYVPLRLVVAIVAE